MTMSMHKMSLLDRYAERSIENEQSYVDNPQRARRLWKRDIAIFITLLVAMIAEDFLDGLLGAFCNVIVGFGIGAAAFSSTRRALSYKSGWLRGRGMMFASMDEAMRRGFTMTEWVRGELARDHDLLCHDDDESETT